MKNSKKNSKKNKKNPVARNMYIGETGFKRQTQSHKAKNKYTRKKKHRDINI